MTDAPLWTPSPNRVERSHMTRIMRLAGQHIGREFADYAAFHSWSCADPAWFWETVWNDARIIHSQSYTSVLTNAIMPGAKWFSGARLNFAENLLRYRDDRTAIIAQCEHRPVRTLTYRELHADVAACAAGLRQLGVGEGDRVAGFLPNIPETIIAMLAATSLGALWSSCSPDFGAQGILDRFGQIEPKVLIASDGYSYHGKKHNLIDRISEIARSIPQIQKIVVVPFLSNTPSLPERAMLWNDLLDRSTSEIEFAQLPFDHPVYIMYSSGTTGKPKCIVHGAGGTLLQHYKEHVYHTDLNRDDVLFYFTTCGWMMWNWLVSALQVGATIFLYEGSPVYPDIEILWRAVDDHKITVFGTSPKFLSSCEHAGFRPIDSCDLSSLRTILSTGSPLSADNFSWVYHKVKNDLQLSSISGGTDIISCFMLGNPILPVYSEEIQSRGLGMAVETYDDAGQPVVDQVGELVCTVPFPSMPVFFWNDPDGAKYRSAYFDVYPGVWRHGDYIKITTHGGVIVYGRSDATLNPGGVRIGTAEIYTPVESLPEVVDSIVVGQNWRNDIRVVLFVVLRDGLILDEALKLKIRETIRSRTTPRHVPSVIIQINEVPRTINAKKVELAVQRIIHGQPISNRDALANPASLDQFRNLPELK